MKSRQIDRASAPIASTRKPQKHLAGTHTDNCNAHAVCFIVCSHVCCGNPRVREMCEACAWHCLLKRCFPTADSEHCVHSQRVLASLLTPARWGVVSRKGSLVQSTRCSRYRILADSKLAARVRPAQSLERLSNEENAMSDSVSRMLHHADVPSGAEAYPLDRHARSQIRR